MAQQTLREPRVHPYKISVKRIGYEVFHIHTLDVHWTRSISVGACVYKVKCTHCLWQIRWQKNEAESY